MSFRKGNQRERRKCQRIQTGVPLLSRVPDLPDETRTLLSRCISRSGRHDCSIHCESEIIGTYSVTRFFYILDKHGVPIELWSETDYAGDKPSELRRFWANDTHPTYHPLETTTPSLPRGGSYSWKPYINPTSHKSTNTIVESHRHTGNLESTRAMTSQSS